MFEALTEKLTGVFNKITSRGVLSDADVDSALREIRIALLEADVSLPVVKELIAKIKLEATGEKLVKSISPGQLVVKIVHDKLLEILGDDDNSLNFNAPAPVVILMAGLQGSGKTTTSAKIAKRLKDKQNKKVLLASLDIYRPAAQEQLEILAKSINGHSLEIIAGQKPQEITKRALDYAKKHGFDVVILDSAGRLQIDDNLMNELKDVKKIANPTEILLVSDAMIGQESCNVAKAFNEALGITGIVLTRIDGSARAGAAISMKMVAGVPIKFLGVGEKISEIEEFYPDRLAGRILGQGDVVSLVEKAMDNIDKAEAEKLAAKVTKGKFDLNDMLSQFNQIKKMGSIGSIVGMIPGLSKFKGQIEEAGSDKLMDKQVAIILSMTKQERKNPDIIKASRKKRIAKGSGVEVHEVNKLLKSYEQMAKMMKQMGKMGGMANLARALNIK
ncbi:MAG: signal recognition particle protein [Alphaproteobacteria bacterium]